MTTNCAKCSKQLKNDSISQQWYFAQMMRMFEGRIPLLGEFDNTYCSIECMRDHLSPDPPSIVRENINLSAESEGKCAVCGNRFAFSTRVGIHFSAIWGILIPVPDGGPRYNSILCGEDCRQALLWAKKLTFPR